MKIFTTEDVRAIDRRTMEVDGIPSRELIKRAARGMADEIMARWRPTRPFVFFAGPGNNGADALAIATIMMGQGYRPTVYLLNIGGQMLSLDCRTFRDEMLSSGGQVNFIEIKDQLKLPELTADTIVIDGLFGTGLREGLQGGFQVLVRYINESSATVVSIDIPSGMTGDLNPDAINRNIVHADLTLTVEFPRISFFLRDNADLVGEWRVVKIGLNKDIIKSTPSSFHIVEEAEVRHLLKPRSPFVSKANLGSALLVTGSYGMAGAAVLSARGALRSGVGKVTAHSPLCCYEIMQSAVPEAMFEPDEHKLVVSGINPRHDYSAIGLGPGLGTNEMTFSALDTFLKVHKRPVVIDADALNCLAARPYLLQDLPVLSVLTPHVGEFDRIFGDQPSDSVRLMKAMEVAHTYQVLILLKGHYTALVRPDSKVYFNPTGTPAMAKGGSGDVLTGLITGLMAQGYKPEVSALMGAYIHGLAGEMAEEEHGVYGVTAGDIAANIGKAIQSIMKPKNEI